MDIRTRNWILLGGDFVVMYLALAVALAIRGGAPLVGQFWDTYFLPFTLLNFAWVCVLFVADLYSRRGLKMNAIFFQALTGATVANTALAVGFFYVVTAFDLTPKTNLALYVTTFTALFCLWRWLIGRRVRWSGGLIPVVFLEVDVAARALASRVAHNPDDGYRLAGVVQTGGFWEVPLGTPISDRAEDVWRFLDEREGVVVVGQRATDEARELLYSLLRRGVTVTDAASFWEELNGEVPTDVADTAWFLNHFQTAAKPHLYSAVKRLADLALAGAAGIFSLPFLPLIALAVMASGTGPIIYCQVRVGRHGRPFLIRKFRSMVADAEKDGARWAEKGDSRVTRVGAFLRHTHLDELPQVWNILRGEMSVVGPRPERPEFVAALEKAVPFYDLRHLVQPGLTGHAQVNYRYGSSVEDTRRKLAFDLYYVKNRSIFLDMKILLKTVIMLARGEGR